MKLSLVVGCSFLVSYAQASDREREFPQGTDDTIVHLEGGYANPANQELADNILHSFFRENGEHARQRLRILMAERVGGESESVRRVLMETYERAPRTPSLGDDTTEEVSQKVFDLFTSTIEDVIQEEEQITEDWERRANGRCKKVTVAILSGILGLAGAAIGAAITAGIESSNC